MDSIILVTGTPGAGKTSAICAISDVVSPVAEAWSWQASAPQDMVRSSVMDHGIVSLAGGDSLHLYGAPGRDWPDFTWILVAEMAAASIILVDGRRPDPVADLEDYLSTFGIPAAQTGSALAVGVTHLDRRPRPGLCASLRKRLDRLNVRPCMPVFEVDGRSRADVKHLLLAITAILDQDAGTPTAGRMDSAVLH